MRVRSGYSFRYAFGKLPDVFERVKELGWGAASISDRESTFAYRKWADLCAKAHIKPVFGVELGVSPSAGAKKTVRDWWTFYAIDDLRPLHDLIAQATARPTACLTYREAISAPGVIKIMGNALLLDNLFELTNKDQSWPLDCYFGLSPSVPRALYTRAAATGMPILITSDNVFLRPEDKELYRCALGTLGKRGARASTQTYAQYLMTDDELRVELSWVPATVLNEAFANRDAALERCNVALRRATLPRVDWEVDDVDF